MSFIGKIKNIIAIAVLTIGAVLLLSGCGIFDLFGAGGNWAVDSEGKMKPDSEYVIEHSAYYRALDENHQTLYAIIYEEMAAGDTEIDIAKGLEIQKEDVKEVVDALYFDHPEFYWWDKSAYGYQYLQGSEVVTNITIKKNSLYDQRSDTDGVLENILDELKTQCEGKSDTDTERIVHDYLAKNITYVSNENDQTIYGALVLNECVCAGYTRAMQYLLNKLGIETYYCVGTAGSAEENEAHAWNIIKLDGEYYNVDLTWDDQPEYISYQYYNLTDAEILQDHTRAEISEILPACEAVGSSFSNLYGVPWDFYLTMQMSESKQVLSSVDDFENFVYGLLQANGLTDIRTDFIVYGEDFYQELWTYTGDIGHYDFIKRYALEKGENWESYEPEVASSRYGNSYLIELNIFIRK